MILGDKPIKNILLKINHEYSISISDLGRGRKDLLEGIMVCNKTDKLIGEPMYFKELSTLKLLVEEQLTRLKESNQSSDN